MQYIYLYLATVPVFFAIDILWLGVLGKPIYDKFLGSFMADPIKWPAAIVFYLLFIVGLLIFAVHPAMGKVGATAWTAVWYGALFGFFTYMTYELTNYAVIKDWPWQIVPIDIAWGILLSGSVAGISFLLSKIIF